MVCQAYQRFFYMPTRSAILRNEVSLRLYVDAVPALAVLS